MQKGISPTRTTTCMKCRKTPSRYYGRWGEEGLCRACILGFDAHMRRRILCDLDPADRKRWQLDELVERAREQEEVRQEQALPPPANSGGTARRYTEPYRHRAPPATPTPGSTDRHERRRHSRVFAELPVRFTVAAGTGRATSSPLHGRTFRSVSKDLSAGGIRIQARDPLLLEIPRGCSLRLEVTVPDDATQIRGTGVVRNVVRTSRGRDTGYLCIQFETLAGAGAGTLRQCIADSRIRHRI